MFEVVVVFGVGEAKAERYYLIGCNHRDAAEIVRRLPSMRGREIQSVTAQRVGEPFQLYRILDDRLVGV
jgi:hypothetical protein